MTEFDFEREPAELDSSEEWRLCELLRSAHAPSEIDPLRHEQLLLSALEDPFAPPSAAELVESERLRRALDGQGEHEDLALARALATAFAARADAPSLIARAAPVSLELGEPRPVPERRQSGGVVLRFAGVGVALAAAAAALLVIRASLPDAPNADLRVLALAQTRSTATLFQADSAGVTSSRIDRIASARSRDLRDNRYALWGVR